jgi:hypothetical protein
VVDYFSRPRTVLLWVDREPFINKYLWLGILPTLQATESIQKVGVDVVDVGDNVYVIVIVVILVVGVWRLEAVVVRGVIKIVLVLSSKLLWES